MKKVENFGHTIKVFDISIITMKLQLRPHQRIDAALIAIS
jgi:hypothetical protein